MDDKIIKRARLHHLLGQYRASNLDPPSVLRFAREAAAAAVERARGKVGKAEAALAEAKSAAEAGDKAQARVVQDTVEALEQVRGTWTRRKCHGVVPCALLCKYQP